MDDMRCLAIGISDAPPLEFLPGAANGAKAFGAWARSLGIETKVLTDENKPVEIADVGMAFTRLLPKSKKIKRLLVYFAGHGLARDAAEDLWLLSQWRVTQRGVAVNSLRRKLVRFGVDQITMISDACRSPASDADSADLTVDPVLGLGPFDAGMPFFDVLRATAPFQAAYMVSGAQPEEDRCIFSGVLLEALQGAHDDAFDSERKCVSNFSLAKFLRHEVPRRAAQYQVDLRPEITPGFEPPDNVYLAEKPAIAHTLAAWPPPGTVGAMGMLARSNTGKRGWSTAHIDAGLSFAKRRRTLKPPAASAPPPPSLPQNNKVEWQAATALRERRTTEILESYGGEGERPNHFETGAGCAIAGGRAKAVTLGRFAAAAGERDGSWWRIERSETSPASFWNGIQLQAPVPMLIELPNGCWIGAAALPGYIATFTIQDGGAASLIYRPVGRPEVGFAAEVAVAQLRSGALSVEAGVDLATKLREGKEEDPVRGILAAYIYDAQGDTDSVRRTAYFLAAAGVPVPFDVAMLAQLTVGQPESGKLIAEIPATRKRTPRSALEAKRGWTFCATPSISAPVAGIFPWLRQGWALLEEEDPSPLFSRGLAALRDDLLAFPFTTVNAHGGKRLRNLIRRM